MSTQLEFVLKDGKEKVLKINFHGWLHQVGIRLSHLSNKLKLKLEVKDELVAEVR